MSSTLRPLGKCDKSRPEAAMRIGILGGGSFGTALAKLLAGLSHEVTLWFHDPGLAREVATQRENRVYLPGVRLPPNVTPTDSMTQAVADHELLVAVSPSHVLREVMLQA